jgi:2-hydroxychromene-2-carboxylate isomerase
MEQIMDKNLDLYFDVGSPASYLAWTQINAIAKRTNATINWQPMLLGGVFSSIGNKSPGTIPAKGRYMFTDLSRYAKDYEVEFNFNPFFPINTLSLMRGAVAYLGTPKFNHYLEGVFKGLWIQKCDMSDPGVVAKILTQSGIDPRDFAQCIQLPEIKNKLKEITEEAVSRGVFGAPTMFVNNEMFFGQDRLFQVEKALQNNV